MASVIKAGNATNGIQITSDATGILEIKTGTGAGTTAITVGTDQAVTFAAGTTVSSLTTSGAVSAGSLTVNSNNISAVNSLGFRNRIINGDMRIDQRNAGASVTPSATATNIYTLDRWAYFQSQASKFAVQQNAGSVTPPVGFTSYLGLTSQSAYSIGVNDYFGVMQIVEGFNTSDLGWGTANAQTITLSFWVRSSLTGTFGGAIQNAAQNRSYPITYTISSANTWEQKTITIAGDTSGTWVGASNSGSVRINFGLGMGSTFSGTAGSWSGSNFMSTTGATSVVGTNGATFYITGVQLEAGSVATPFERRDYGRELIMAQRYYYKNGQLSLFSSRALSTPNSNCGLMTYWPVTMRGAPTVADTGNGNITSLAVAGITVDGAYWTGSASSGVSTANITGYTASAEL